MTPTRCPTCRATIAAQLALGREYSERREGSAWHVAFLGAESRRGTGATLHAALDAVAWLERRG